MTSRRQTQSRGSGLKYGLIAFRDDLTCDVYKLDDINGPRRKVSGASVKLEVNGVTKRGTLVSVADNRKCLLLEKEKVNVAKFFGVSNPKDADVQKETDTINSTSRLRIDRTKSTVSIPTHQHGTRLNTKRKLALNQVPVVERPSKVPRRLGISKIPIRAGSRPSAYRNLQSVYCSKCKATIPNNSYFNKKRSNEPPKTDKNESFEELAVLSPLPECISPILSVKAVPTSSQHRNSTHSFIETPMYTSSPIKTNEISNQEKLISMQSIQWSSSPPLADPSTPTISTSFASSSSSFGSENLTKSLYNSIMPTHFDLPLIIEPPTPSMTNSNHFDNLSISDIETLLQSITDHKTPKQESIDTERNPLTNEWLISGPKKVQPKNTSIHLSNKARRCIHFDPDPLLPTIGSNKCHPVVQTKESYKDISIEQWLQDNNPPLQMMHEEFVEFDFKRYPVINPNQSNKISNRSEQDMHSPHHWVYSSPINDEVKHYADENTTINIETTYNNLSPLVNETHHQPSNSMETLGLEHNSQQNLRTVCKAPVQVKLEKRTTNSVIYPTQDTDNTFLPIYDAIPNVFTPLYIQPNQSAQNSNYMPFSESLARPIHLPTQQPTTMNTTMSQQFVFPGSVFQTFSQPSLSNLYVPPIPPPCTLNLQKQVTNFSVNPISCPDIGQSTTNKHINNIVQSTSKQTLSCRTPTTQNCIFGTTQMSNIDIPVIQSTQKIKENQFFSGIGPLLTIPQLQTTPSSALVTMPFQTTNSEHRQGTEPCTALTKKTTDTQPQQLVSIARPKLCSTPLPSFQSAFSFHSKDSATTSKTALAITHTVTTSPRQSSTAFDEELAKKFSKYAVIDNPKLLRLTGAHIMKRFITSGYIQRVLDELPDQPTNEPVPDPYIIDAEILRFALHDAETSPRDFAVYIFDRIFTVHEFRGRSTKGLRRPILNKSKINSIKEAVFMMFPMDDHKWMQCIKSINSHVRTLDRKINRLPWLKIDNY